MSSECLSSFCKLVGLTYASAEQNTSTAYGKMNCLFQVLSHESVDNICTVMKTDRDSVRRSMTFVASGKSAPAAD